MEITGHGLYRAEHRALRELYATARQLCGHWERLADRVGGRAATALTHGAGACNELLEELATRSEEHGLHIYPAAHSAGSRFAGLRNNAGDLLLERNQAVRVAVLDVQHVTTLLAYLGNLAATRGDEALAGFHRRWEERLRAIEDEARQRGDRARLRARGGDRARRPGRARPGRAPRRVGGRQRGRGDRRLPGRPRGAPLQPRLNGATALVTTSARHGRRQRQRGGAQRRVLLGEVERGVRPAEPRTAASADGRHDREPGGGAQQPARERSGGGRAARRWPAARRRPAPSMRAATSIPPSTSLG